MMFLQQSQKKKMTMLLLFLVYCGVCNSFSIHPQPQWSAPHIRGLVGVGNTSPKISTTTKRTISVQKLHMFNKNNMFGNNNLNDPVGKPKDWKDVFQRCKLILVRSASQFPSTYVTGYVFATVWGFLRGSAYANNPVAWGIDFGIISVWFKTVSETSRLLFSPKAAKSPWTDVIRNGLLGAYLTRSLGWYRMLRSLFFYGGLTYYFATKQKKRMSEMGMFGGGGNMQELFQRMSGPTAGGMGGAQAASMQELLQRMSSSTTAGGGMAGSNVFFTSSNGSSTMEELLKQQQSSSSPQNASADTKPSSSAKKKKKKPKRNNALDVEWEPVDETKNTEGDV